MKLAFRSLVVASLVLTAALGLAQIRIQSGLSATPIFTMMHQPDVAKELALTESQKKALEKASDGAVFRQGDRVGLRITPEMDLDEMEAASLKVLNDKQRTRLFEIYSQHQGLIALAHPTIAKWFGLEPGKAKKLEAIVEDHQNEMMEIAHANGGRIDTHEHASEIGGIKKKTEDRIRALLTPAELKSWEAKKGKQWAKK
ncbi:MAG: hypothetical protein HONBIEJF_02385 [Fimbriimonadaceae bacterium]|nr:hypothetical protein [Fimbriimonadaceae bacterium]